jgi:hypothetical protein
MDPIRTDVATEVNEGNFCFGIGYPKINDEIFILKPHTLELRGQKTVTLALLLFIELHFS